MRRVVSLLPAATETVVALGCAGWLVGVSHECDLPPEAAGCQRVTRCTESAGLDGNALPSAEVDRRVREALQSGGSLYTLNVDLLRELRPDLILTQGLCDVCAIDRSSVAALAGSLPGPPEVLSLEPLRFAEVLDDLRRVAAALGVPERGDALLRRLGERIEKVRRRVAECASRNAPRPRCLLLEWPDPPYSAGHWNPELVELAGGEPLLAGPGEPSRRVSWDAVRAAAPEVLVLAACGYPIARTLEDLPILRRAPGWSELPAVAAGRVYVADGHRYFARPGPSLVDSLELLAACLHPEAFPEPPASSVRRIEARG